MTPLSSLTPIQAQGAGEGLRTGQTHEGAYTPFADTLKNAIGTLQEAQAAAAQDSYNLAVGNVSDLHSVMINSGIETAAVETVVQLTSRAVSAYKEIMQMQV